MTDAAAWGIAPGYHDYRREWRQAPAWTSDALLRAMRADGPVPPGMGDDSPVWVLGAGQPAQVKGHWRLRTEDGAELRVSGALPPELPPGYHELLREADGHRVRLVLSPRSCFTPERLHTWGWAVQLYAARSESSWGMGDLGDLRRLARWSAGQGAGMVLVNPLHATAPAGRQQASPYFPSSRCFHNPLYLRVEDVPGAWEAGLDVEELAAAGRALNGDRGIDRDAVWRLKRLALERLWERFAGDPAFDRYCDEQGPALAGYATYSAVAEEHGPSWPSWPAGLRNPEGRDVLRFIDGHRRRIRFHQWLQWLVDVQLAAAAGEIDLAHDMAIGVDPAGADAWLWQDCLALGVRVGAPPDEFNTRGQDWGLPPFDPWRLRSAVYEPFIQTVRAGFRHGGGVRLDHVMGLFRLFWIPPEGGPADGTYVRYPWQELLDIVALESHRARAYVVGEDLGTVEPFMREELACRDVLSYRLLWFEQEPPRRFPVRALVAVTTHDLPTVAGLWSGADLDEQERLGLAPNAEATADIRRRLQQWTGLRGDEPPAETVVRTYRLLAEAPSAVVTATLDDAVGVEERPNMPGTTDDQRANWSLALPLTLEQIETDATVAAVAAALAARVPEPLLEPEPPLPPGAAVAPPAPGT